MHIFQRYRKLRSALPMFVPLGQTKIRIIDPKLESTRRRTRAAALQESGLVEMKQESRYAHSTAPWSRGHARRVLVASSGTECFGTSRNSPVSPHEAVSKICAHNKRTRVHCRWFRSPVCASCHLPIVELDRPCAAKNFLRSNRA
jgi:hypothetical protein